MDKVTRSDIWVRAFNVTLFVVEVCYNPNSSSLHTPAKQHFCLNLISIHWNLNGIAIYNHRRNFTGYEKLMCFGNVDLVLS
mmetsp:Transcript_14145/g.21166  ORF Transcript_14145/g.21166 Transcript_14145/m.21166 type:complete len:81 (+) Transcript_14145:2249-2491(+)